MNESTGNSNTSGKDVANVSYWPKYVLPFVRSAVSQLAVTIQRIINKEVSPAVVDFAPKGSNDTISDSRMAEITRRLIVTLESPTAGIFFFGPTPPSDLSKIWGQTDPVSGVLVGQLKKYDEDSKSWIPTVETAAPYSPPKEQVKRVFVPAGTQTVNVDFEDMGRTDYFPTITATTWNGTTYGGPPGTVPNPNGLIVSNQTATQLTFVAYAVPTGGLGFDVKVRNPEV